MYCYKNLTKLQAIIYKGSLKQYKILIDNDINKMVRYGTNRIKRCNLSICTHLKRFSR
ncbi:hypothetical protein CCAN12_430026 [Capnocytophaga canimorsus]|uniref:Uncharacterized protein n=1 Tax=Capnocytophaga canimorsus TaxID=28188 RepID=A0A0B7ITX2_9FLAO|nr:hypothetical protein CAPN009_14900 [Capnocytophaga canimorsus]CEN33534.1 hypothetical protein CCAN12_430026 [Capnocytophaga canimorsus]CEN53552.1 hypothetical protein CCAN11_990002 [Capnocytophaga canimorsus]